MAGSNSSVPAGFAAADRTNEGENAMKPLGAVLIEDGDGAWVSAIEIEVVDDEQIVVIATRDGSVIVEPLDVVLAAIRDNNAYERCAQIHSQGWIRSIAIDPADRHLVAFGGPHGALRYSLDAPTKMISELGSFADFVTGVAWSTDGRSVIVTSADGTVVSFDVPEPEAPISLVDRLNLHAGPVRWVAVAAGGESFVTVSDQPWPHEGGIGTVALWEFGGQRLRTVACGVAVALSDDTTTREGVGCQ